MSRPAEATHEPALEIRFGQVGLAQLRLRTTDPAACVDELTGRIASAPPGFFERTAVCVDLTMLEREPEIAEMRTVLDAVRRAGMLVVGLTSGTDAIAGLARALAPPILPAFRVPKKPPAPTQVPTVQPAAAAGTGAAALVHQQPVRSGQRVYARQRDLVVTATVGAGAEVMADGCVHVYGALRGRAMAGARGETAARIFCLTFHAELVSIAGVFRVFETIPGELAGQPVQAWLDGDALNVARLGG